MTRAVRRRLPIPPGNGHIEIETLAALAEGRVGEPMATDLAAHLAECRSCMAAYADAVRYASAWRATPGAFTPTPAMVREGERVAASRGSRRSLARRFAPVVGLAVLAAAAGFVAWRMQPSVPVALRAALERESSQSLVLPGGESGADRQTPVQRGADGGDVVLEAAVSQAVRRYESGARSASAAYQAAAGLMISGNLDAARDYVTEGLAAHPDDRALGILSAALAFRNSDLAGAETALRGVLRRSPADDVATLDLAIVLAERGARAESRSLLERLIAREPGTPLARRAAKLLGGR
jgi:tetratricopeptide (TPR) repeat protein